MQEKVAFNFYGIGVQLKGLSEFQIEILRSDFSYFCYRAGEKVETWIDIDITKVDEYKNLIPANIGSTKQTSNSIYYDVGDVRYNDYYGKALSIINYNAESVNIYYTDEGFIHELLYLLVLSRTGKYLDRKGMHKIHACGINYKNKNLILMMSSKGGKTTTFCELLQDEEVNIISDDTPIITNKGEVLPFPLRIGSESKEFLKNKFSYLSDEDLSFFKREHYSAKYVVNLKKIKNKVESNAKEDILVVGIRSTFDIPLVEKTSKLKMLKHMLEHMVVGIGLPMIVEYFLQNTIKDHFVNFAILLSRIKASLKILGRSRCYKIYLSENINLNATMLKELIDER